VSVVPSTGVRVLVDYRPALRARTGIGEYVHELARALTCGAGASLDLTVFSSSWRDRVLADAMAELPGVRVVDRPIPVAALTWSWHRGWPPIEWLAGAQDVVHSPTPLLLPTSRAARVVTVFDLYFLTQPSAVRGATQRDFTALVRDHVRRADHVVAGSHYAAGLVTGALGIAPERVTTTPLGAPGWAADVRARCGRATGRTLLFLGTLETRKNVGLLLDAYELLLARRRDVPPLVLAGALGAGGDAWVTRATRAPLASHVRVTGYVSEAERRALYAEARAVVMPSLDEGFGLPALEAMACGAPVIATPVGALPEVLGEAGLFAPLGAPDAWAAALDACTDDSRMRELAARGLAQAARYRWSDTAAATLDAYRAAAAARAERR
jgi:glycosyltransferase involved in cell wall biosynthesis